MKKIYNLLMAFGVLCMVSSCDDALNKYPLDDLTEESYYENATQLQFFTNSFYSSILPDAPYDEQSDLLIGNNPSNLLLNGSFRTVPASGGGWSWTTLRKINTCLGNLYRCPDPAVAREYEALCKFFRAWFYFDKVQKFGDVPWIDHEMASNEEQLYAPRDSRELIMKQMIEDLDNAIDGLPSSYASGYTFRVTKWAAMALKARVCLFEGTFRKYHNGDITLWTLPADANPPEYYLDLAAAAAKQLMDESPHFLYTTNHPDYDYQNLFSQYVEDTGEFILAIDYDYSLKCYHNATGVALLPACGRNSPTRGFVDHYLMADGSRYSSVSGWGTKSFADQVAGRDPRLHQTIRIPGYNYTVLTTNRAMFCDLECTLTGYSLNKFVMPSDNLVMGNVRDYSYNDLPVIRLAEVYLIYAEACLGNSASLTGEGLQYFNAVRRRAGIDEAASITFEDIIRERRVEFGVEFMNWYSMLEWYKWKPNFMLNYLNNQYRGCTYNEVRVGTDNELSFYHNPDNDWEEVISTEFGDLVAPDVTPTITKDNIFLPYPEADVIQNPYLKREPEHYNFNE